MRVSAFRGLIPSRRALPGALTLLLLALAAVVGRAASISGVVTDATGAKVTGATVILIHKGKAIATAVSTADGSFNILTGVQGRFYLLVSAKGFRELNTPSFYAGSLDTVEHNLVLEPEWARESIVVTATGTPTPQPQTSSATTVLGPGELAERQDLVSALRLMPGVSVVQAGERGAQTALFVRGGDSDANEVLMDGVSVGDLGGRFDFGTLTTTAVESAEVYRGPNSSLYGADAESGVVSLTTPRGTTSFPSITLQGDVGNFFTSHERAEIAGAHSKIDYLGDFSWFQTANSLPNDEEHEAVSAANVGWQPTGNTQVRGTLHYGVAATGAPNAWEFYHVADDATQKDQDIYLSAGIDNQTTPSFHNALHYGLTRKREEYNLWQPSGTLMTYDTYGDQAYFGQPVTITGANGASVSGQAQLDYPEAYPYQYWLDSNRDQVIYQGDYQFTPHLAGLLGFRFENERGMETNPDFSTYDTTARNNYDYIAAVHGDWKERVFYTLGGSLQHYAQFGTQNSPRAGVTGYILRPRSGIFSGTRALFNFGKAVREPALTEQFSSLYQFLVSNGYASTATQANIGPLAAPQSRTYEGGGEQGFLSNHILLRVSYFHNEFGREIEDVGGTLLPNLIPGLTPSQRQQLITALGYYYTQDYPLEVNTGAFRAQGIESSVEGGIGRNIFLRGGYTYLDTVTQHSFDSDNEALLGGYAPTYPYNCTLGTPGCVAVGAISPLDGARQFRRPPHTGFFTATYSSGKIAAEFTSSFASRSDDSTYLEFADTSGGNSLLLPNRDLDHGFADLGATGNYQLLNWLGIYGQASNLLSNQNMAPIGYPSLPMTVRVGLTLLWGPGSKQ